MWNFSDRIRPKYAMTKIGNLSSIVSLMHRDNLPSWRRSAIKQMWQYRWPSDTEISHVQCDLVNLPIGLLINNDCGYDALIHCMQIGWLWRNRSMWLWPVHPELSHLFPICSSSKTFPLQLSSLLIFLVLYVRSRSENAVNVAVDNVLFKFNMSIGVPGLEKKNTHTRTTVSHRISVSSVVRNLFTVVSTQLVIKIRLFAKKLRDWSISSNRVFSTHHYKLLWIRTTHVIGK